MGLFQALFLLFGAYNIAAIAVAWLVLALVGAALSWRLASACEGHAGGESSAGPWAGALFAVSVGTVGGTLNTEIPAAVAAAAAVLVWARAARSRDSRESALMGLGALAGALAAASFLCRQNGGALWPLLLAGEAVLVLRGRRALRAALRSAIAVSAGFLAATGAVFALYAMRGTLFEMLLCFFGYNAGIYIAATKVSAARLVLAPLAALRSFFLPVWTTAILGALGLGVAASSLKQAGRARAPAAGAAPSADDGDVVLPVVALVAIGLTLSLFPGLRLFSHYAAMPLPFWAALGGVAAARLTRPRVSRVARVVTAIVALSLGAELARRPWLPAARGLRAWVREGGLRDPGDPLLWPGRDPLAAKAARWIREHGGADDTVFVWGMRPHVPVYARRVPATRFVTCTFLTGLVPWERVGSEEDTSRWIVPGSWDLLSRDLDAERPRFIVDASLDHLFGMGAYEPSKFPELQQRLDTSYERVFDTGGDERLVIWRRRGPLTSTAQ